MCKVGPNAEGRAKLGPTMHSKPRRKCAKSARTQMGGDAEVCEVGPNAEEREEGGGKGGQYATGPTHRTDNAHPHTKDTRR